jgi:hypothetical protein
MVEYIQALALWAWPIVTLLLVLVFRKEIRWLLSMIATRGFKATLGSASVIVPSVEDNKAEGGAHVGKVTAEVKTPSGLTEFQTKILKEFVSRGDYDTLNVSKTLINDFRQLKEYGFFRWTQEEDKGDQVALSKFRVTEEGKIKI